MKTCNKCREEKPLYLFYNDKTRNDGKHPWCKSCHNSHRTGDTYATPGKMKDRRLKRVYGISLDEYNTMLSQQQGACYICGTKHHDNDPLNVDHCHIEGYVRKLLCRRCNLTLGMVNDDIELLRKMIDYLS